MDSNLSGLVLVTMRLDAFDARNENAYYARPSWDWRLPAWIGRLAAALVAARGNLTAVTTTTVTFG